VGLWVCGLWVCVSVVTIYLLGGAVVDMTSSTSLGSLRSHHRASRVCKGGIGPIVCREVSLNVWRDLIHIRGYSCITVDDEDKFADHALGSGLLDYTCGPQHCADTYSEGLLLT
jgi:hypothetical protein